MKRKYITLQTMLTYLSKPVSKKDIHSELEETIAERKRIMKQLEGFSIKAKIIDIYRGVSQAA
jgi:hypothetical protein